MTRIFYKIILRARLALEFSHGLCHKQTFEVRFTPDRPLFGGLRGASAFRGPLLAGCTRGEERNHGAGERTGGEEIQTCLETAGRILDPADDEGADITAKVTDGID